MCYRGQLSGSTGATEAEFEAMFAARGFEAGYGDGEQFKATPSWRTYRKPGSPVAYQISTPFTPNSKGSAFALSEVPSRPPDQWAPLKRAQMYAKVPELRAALAKKMQERRTAVLAAAQAPANCPPQIAQASPLPKRTDFELGGRLSTWPRADAPFMPSNANAEYELKELAAFDAAPYLPLMVVTNRISPSLMPGVKMKSWFGQTLDGFESGREEFFVGVVDARSGAVACRRDGAAQNSDIVELSKREHNLSQNADQQAKAILESMLGLKPAAAAKR
jgi:hypothetical protein